MRFAAPATATVCLMATISVGCGGIIGPDAVSPSQGEEPVTVTEMSGAGVAFAAAVSPRGRSVVVWLNSNRVWATESEDGRTWQPARALQAEPYAIDHRGLELELDDEGNGFAAWTESVQGTGVVSLVVCRYEAATGWEAPRPITRLDWRVQKPFALAVEPEGGDASIVWGGWEGVWAATWNGREWSAAEPLESGVLAVDEVTVRARGRTTIAAWRSRTWDRWPQTSFVRASIVDPARGWSQPFELGRAPETVLHRPAVDSRGTATVLWGVRDEYGSLVHGQYGAYVRATGHDPARGWQAPVELGHFSAVLGLEAHEADALTALVVVGDPVETSSCLAIRYLPGLGWRQLGSTAVAGVFNAASLAPRSRQALVRTPDGDLRMARPGPTWSLEAVPDDAERKRACADAPFGRYMQISVDASGARTAVWRQFDCLGSRIKAWRLP